MRMRRTYGATLACIALALVLGACPSSKKEEAQPSPSASAALLNTPWQLVDKAGSALKVRVYEGGCFTFQRVEAQESEREVVVAAKSSLDTSGRVCPSDLRSHDETITLKDPLGDRTLTAAPLSQEAQRAMPTLPPIRTP